MKFRTELTVQPEEFPISYQSKILLLGSCFVQNIGERLDYFKFQSYRNPFGILYHPVALEQFLRKAVEDYTYTDKDIFFHNERWHCFDAHSELSNADNFQLLEDLNENLRKTKSFLKETTHVIITLGTAWSYYHLESDKIVANCHKLPQKIFKKQLIGVNAMVEKLRAIQDLISEVNPRAYLIFTVSPVRHLKDGIIENQLSKAHLISAIHEVIRNSNTFYFPSYEIMMDDLRDYRYYAEDMLHPNKIAIDYIWNKFTETWISKADFDIMERVNIIQKGLSHKPFNKNSEAHKKFITQLYQNMDSLIKQYSWMKF